MGLADLALTMSVKGRDIIPPKFIEFILVSINIEYTNKLLLMV